MKNQNSKRLGKFAQPQDVKPTNRLTNETHISGLFTNLFVKFCLKGSRRNYQYESLVWPKYYFEKIDITGAVTKQLIVFGLKIQNF